MVLTGAPNNKYAKRLFSLFAVACFCIFFGLGFTQSTYATECSVGMTTSGDINFYLLPGDSGVETSNITATSDCSDGYTVYISGPQDATLYHNGDDTSEDYVSTVSGTKTEPTVLSTDTYGYSLGEVSTTSNSFIGLTSAPTILVAKEEASAVSGDTYTVSYGASIAANKLAGTYQMTNDGVVTYAIIANGMRTATVTFNANGGLFQNDAVTNQVILEEDSTAILSGEYLLPTRDGFSFAGWYTDTTYNTEANLGILDSGNITVYAKWETDGLQYVYKTPGSCIFGGASASITSNTNSCISYINPEIELINYASDLDSFIDTGVSLYSGTNVGRDFEVGFTIDDYDGGANGSFATLFSSKLENSGAYGAGLIFRKDDGINNQFQLRQRLRLNNTTSNVDATFPFTNPITSPIDVILERKNGVISYSFNGGAMAQLDDREVSTTFNIHALFGATADSSVTADMTIGSVQRYLIGTLSNLYIKMGPEKPTDYAAKIGESYYETLQAAVDAVPANGTKTTIQLLKDVSEYVDITNGRNVYLDLNNYTVSNNGDENVFHIVSNGIFEPVNGTIVSTASTKAVIENDQSTILRIGNVAIQANGERQAIYNYGGNITISDGAVVTSSAPARAAVQNKNSGAMVITGGTITSTTLYAVYNENGSLTIGTKDGTLDITSPVIQGKTYGVVAYSPYRFYDGIIKGETAAIGATANTGNTPTVTTDTTGAKISDIDVNTQKTFGQDGDYKTLYLTERDSEIISIRVEIPDTFPTSSSNSPLVPMWTLGSPSYKIGVNAQAYESVLLSKTQSSIDIVDIPINASNTDIADWYSVIGRDQYYLPVVPDGHKRIRITMDDGYETNNSRKNPKVVFLQGNSPSSLTPNGANDGSGGATDIPNTFGERQITNNPTQVYQIENGSIIDLSPYWDDSALYHAISIRGYGSSLDGIRGATIEYIPDEEEQPDYEFIGTVTRTVSKSFQGALADENSSEIFQIMDDGHTMVLDLYTLDVKREFDLPTSDGSGHFSSVEWLDKTDKTFMTTSGVCSATNNANKIYIYDMSDESDITITTIISPDLSSDYYSCMGDLAYDSQNKLLYVGGYSPNDTTRSNLIITTIDMSPYVDNGLTTVYAVGDVFTTTIYHLQDGAFYNGKIYYLVDSTTGRGSYNTFATLEISPTTKDISRVLEISLSQYEEAESLIVVPVANPYLIMSYWDGSSTEYYYKRYLDT